MRVSLLLNLVKEMNIFIQRWKNSSFLIWDKLSAHSFNSLKLSFILYELKPISFYIYQFYSARLKIWFQLIPLYVNHIQARNPKQLFLCLAMFWIRRCWLSLVIKVQFSCFFYHDHASKREKKRHHYRHYSELTLFFRHRHICLFICVPKCLNVTVLRAI